MPNTNGLIIAAAGEALTIRAKMDGVYAMQMAPKLLHTGFGVDIPHPNQAIFTTTNQARAISPDGQAPNPIGVTL